MMEMETVDVAILGGGIAGLAAAHALGQASAEPPITFRLLEASQRLGGKVRSEAREGFLLEAGPDAVLAAKPQARRLVEALGLDDQWIGSRDARRKLYLLQAGRLTPLPAGWQLLVPTRLGPFLRFPLLSPAAKLRVLAERFQPPRREEGDESVADFVRRRIGAGALENLAEPLLAHIHAGDLERMSLAATYPTLAALERRHGSLTRAFAAAPKRTEGAAFWTLRGGLETLIRRLAAALPADAIRLGYPASELRPHRQGLEVRSTAGPSIVARQVILALPAFVAADLVEAWQPELARSLRAIRHVSLATVSLGYSRAAVGHPLDGFGFFVPRREGLHTLACTWSSSKFDDRAPDGQVLMRIFVGGAWGEEALELDDDALAAAIHQELAAPLDLRRPPGLVRVFRWDQGYPQYEVGHRQRVTALESTCGAALHLAGSAFHGVGIPDCIASGQAAAGAALDALEQRERAPESGGRSGSRLTRPPRAC